MKRFETIYALDQVDLALEALKMMFDGKCHTLEQLVAKRDCTAAELWREICSERGHDECEPWEGWPDYPRKSSFANGPGATDPLPTCLQTLHDKMQIWLGRDKH